MSGLILPFEGHTPKIGRDVFIAPSATIIGDVEIGDEANIWFGAVLRGDIGAIRVGARTNIQDLACVHLTEGQNSAILGADITVGHGAILHGCTIQDGCLIGMGAVVLDDAVIGENSVIAAGTIVPPRMVVPPGSMVRGNPGRVLRAVKPDEAEMGRRGAEHYVINARKFMALFAARAGQ